MANETSGALTTAPPDDDFENSLAVFHHDLRAVMSEADCQSVVDRIRSVHASFPDMPFDDAAEFVRATMSGLVRLKTYWEDLGMS
ncbi:hypothetical protein ACL07V_37550 [Streptomyces sp. MB22_4]|uniref:hypothetical protein n=1 Tax=Streptomyces sp. MB22_4 TaxID=3383120 RepID=UPI0039A0A05B